MTRHVEIRYDTRRKRATPRTDLPTALQQKDLALLHVRLAGPRMEDMLTPSGVRPLWAGGLWAGGLAAWQPGSLAYLELPLGPAGSALLPRSRNEARQHHRTLSWRAERPSPPPLFTCLMSACHSLPALQRSAAQRSAARCICVYVVLFV